MPPKGKSKRPPTKGKGRGRKKAVVPSPQPRRLIPIDESEKEDLEEREKTAEPSPEELVEEKQSLYSLLERSLSVVVRLANGPRPFQTVLTVTCPLVVRWPPLSNGYLPDDYRM